MFCKNCGKEIADTAKFCDGCGQDFSKPTEKKNLINTLFDKVKQSKIILGGIVGLVALLIIAAIIVLNLPNKPNEKQIIDDFTTQILKNEDYSIKEFNIINENVEENKYNAIVNIIYDNSKTEHDRQYKFSYTKTKDWQISEILAHEEDLWEKHPLQIPNIEDYTNVCKEKWPDDLSITKFAPLHEKTSVDLNKGITTFYFSVESNTPISTATGDVSFLLNYDFASEEWCCDSLTLQENYVVTTDFLKEWSGSSKPKVEKDFWGNYYDTENFSIKITKNDGNIAEAILTFQNAEYPLTGTIKHEDKYGPSATIYLKDATNKFHVNGSITREGNLSVEIGTNDHVGSVALVGDTARRYLYNVVMTLK